MNEIEVKNQENALLAYASFADYDRALENEIRKEGESFIRIGYLLRLGEDTDIIRESGYASVWEYAEKKFHIDTSQASRYMNVNRRFSEGGYSERIAEQYRGFGIAKLVVMLQIPDEINEELTPEYSKTEIQTIKEEVKEEQKVSDIELLIEGKKEEQKRMETVLEKTINQLLEDEPDLYKALYEARATIDSDPDEEAQITVSPDVEEIKSILAPSGEKIYFARIEGKGRVILSLKESEDRVTVTPVRTPEEKEVYTWQQMADVIGSNFVLGVSVQDSYKTVFHKDFPKKEAVTIPERSVQGLTQTAMNAIKAASNQPKPAKEKDTKVHKAKVEEPKAPEPEEKEKIAPVQQSEQMLLHDVNSNIPAPDPLEPEEAPLEIPENAINTKCDADIPGQDNVLNHPEYLPEDMTEVIPPENAINTKCGGDLDSPETGVIEGDTCAMTEEDWEETWNNAADAHMRLDNFFNYWGEKEEVAEQALRKAYTDAVNLAAGLEKLINGKEHHA